MHDNSEDAWLKLLMLPKCVLLAPKSAGRHHKPVSISRPNGPKVSSVHYGIEHPSHGNLLVSKHPKGTPPTPSTAPLLAAPCLPPDFNIMAVLHSFLLGLRLQHLIEAAEVPLQLPIWAVLREVVKLLISGKVPVQVARFLAKGNLVALEKTNPTAPPPPTSSLLQLERLSGVWL